MNTYKHTVHYYETDRMGITHHSNYIRWMEEARIDYLHQIGCDYAEMEERGIISPVTAVDCKYKVSTKFAEEIEIAVTTESFSGVVLKLKYEMKNANGKTVCIGHSEHCFLNEAGRIIRLNREFPDIYETIMNTIPKEQK